VDSNPPRATGDSSYRVDVDSCWSLSTLVSYTSLLVTLADCVTESRFPVNPWNVTIGRLWGGQRCWISYIHGTRQPLKLTFRNIQLSFNIQLNCRVKSRRRCVRNSQLVGDSLDKSEQICQQRSRIGGVNAPVGSRDSWPSLQFPVLLSYWGWWQPDIMTSLLKKLSISIKIHVVKQL